MKNPLSTLATLLLALSLCGCAGMRAYQEGNALLAQGKPEQGLSKLEQAVQLDPKNAQYRIALASQRTTWVNRLVSQGESLHRAGQLTEAEKSYRQVQTMEPENLMAKQGLDALAKERRHRIAIDQAKELQQKSSPADWLQALEKLRPVLAENPNHKEALNLKARLDEQRSKEQQTEPKLAATFRSPISLEFREAPLRSVFEVISKVSNLNFLYDKEIKPDLKATIFAKNTTVEDALRLLLVTNQLEFKVLNDNAVLIYPSSAQKLKEYQSLSVRSFYLTNADVKNVANSIKTLVKTKDLVTDERLGIIIMRDTPEAIRMAERIVALQDLSDPEVMLEVEILEIKRSKLLELGVQWPAQVSLSPLLVQGAPLTLNALRNLNRDTVQANVGTMLINARKEDQEGNVLANPRIRVRNKEKAKIQIGDRVPVITTTTNATFSTESVNYVDVGLKLEVEPTIYLDQEVAIKINLEVSNLVREILSKSGTLSYQIGTRGANTVLRLKDGETQILAGLISDEDRATANKVPLLGELPLAGRFFGSQKEDTQRSEILLSITPRVVRAIARPDMLSAEFESGTESSIGTPSLRLGNAEPAAKAAPPPAGSSTDPAAIAPLVNPATPANAAATGSITLSWKGPDTIKTGEQFSLSLQLTSSQALRSAPLLLSFDPQVLQVASVQEGSFFKQGGSATHFSQRVDPAQGKVYVATVRQGDGPQANINGSGELMTITFKALKPEGLASVQLLSVSPEPVPQAPLSMPLVHKLKITP
jgi:general secretion pathway protein D